MGFVDRLTIIAAILLAICEGACPPRKPHSVVIPQTDLPGGYIAQQPAIDSAMTRAFLRAEATSSAEKSSPSRPPLPIVSVPLTPSVVQAGRMQLSLRHAPVTILCLPCRILLSRPSQRSNGPVRRRCLSTSSRDSIRWIRTSSRGRYARHLLVGLQRCCLCTLYGQPAELAALHELARAYGLGLIEDCEATARSTQSRTTNRIIRRRRVL